MIKVSHFVQFTVLILLVSLLDGCSNEQKKKPRSPISVDVQTISKESIPVIKQYIGITQSIESVEIRARVTGFLTEKHFTEGKDVKKNQLLYVIDPRPFKAKLDHVEAVLKSNIAERDYQALEYIRFKKLAKQGNVAQVRFDTVNAKLKEAQASVALAKADVEEAKLNLSYCYMKAPYAGKIGVQFIDIGNYVGSTNKTLLAKLVQLNPIYVEFSPSVNDYSEFLHYRANMPFKVSVSLPSYNKHLFKGRIDIINNEANVSTSTILMRATIKNAEKTLLPGIYVTVNVTLSDNSKQLLIPANVIINVQGRRSVYVVGQNNKVESRLITTSGSYQGKTVIQSGLKEGEQIITSNLQKLRSGITVTIKKAN